MRAQFSFALLFCLLACGLCGCSRIYVETSPFAKEPVVRIDAEQNATRVNGWPLYYQLGPNLSVLWPLFQKDDKGFALYPLFETYADPYRSTFALLYLIGAKWNEEGYDSSYFLPFWIAPEKRELFTPLFAHASDGTKHYTSWLWLLHFWSAQDWRAQLILPLYYYYRSDGRWQINTLLYNRWQHGDRNVTNIGGFLYHHASDAYGQYLALLWPLFNFWSGADHGQLIFPVYYYYYRSPEEWRFNSLFYNHRETPEASYIHYAGPLYYHIADKIAPFENYTAWVWPLLQRWTSPETSALLVLPFYYFSSNTAGDWNFYSLLYNQRKSAVESLLNFGGPLFYQSKSANGDFLRTILWPLFISSQTGTIGKLFVLPLFYRRTDTSTAEKTVITPLGGFSRAGDGSGYLNLLGPLYHHAFDPQSNHYFRMFTPLVALWGSAPEGGIARGGHWVLPLYAYWRREPANYWFHSLPYSQWRNEGSWHWLSCCGLLFDYHRHPQYLNWGTLLHMIHFTRYTAEIGGHWEFAVQPLIPIVELHNDRFFTLLFGYRWPKSKDALHKELVQLQTVIKGQEYPSYVHTETGWHFLPLIYHKSLNYAVENAKPIAEIEQSPEIDRFFTIFPFYFSTLRQGVEKSHLLWIIWQSKKDFIESGGEKLQRVRKRLLWRIYDYERVGDVTSVDIFPFITYDRDRERKYLNYSFLGPIFRRVKSGEQRNLQILGVRFGPKIDYSKLNLPE